MNANCPYCWEELDIDPEDYGEDGSTQQHECEHCNKTFIFVTEMVVDITTFKAECLNGAEHKYERIHRLPLILGGKLTIRCADCGEEKDIPIEDGEKYGYTKKEIADAIEFKNLPKSLQISLTKVR